MGILPPPKTFSCGCNPRNQINTVYVNDPSDKEPTKIKFPDLKIKNNKVDIIILLKRYMQDTTTKAEKAAFEAVIEWFINCTPDYKEDDES
jgi:hypothetical protein